MRYYIALGVDLCRYFINNQYKEAGDCIASKNGDIIAYNPTEDSFEELIETISGWTDLMVLDSEKLDKISDFVELDRPVFKVGDDMLPIEKLTEFLKESSIKELISKQILVT